MEANTNEEEAVITEMVDKMKEVCFTFDGAWLREYF